MGQQQQTPTKLMIPNIWGLDRQWDSHPWRVEFYRLRFFCQQNNCTCKLRQHGRLHMQVTYGLLLIRCCCEFLLLVKLFQQLTVVSRFTVPSWEKAAKCLTCLKVEWIGLLSNNIMCHTLCKDEACVKSSHALKRHFLAYCLLQSEDEEEQTRHND